MSSTQSLIIIIFVIILIVAVALIIMGNRHQLGQIEALDRAIEHIKNMHLELDIKRLDEMDLAGESLTTLKTWRKSYQEVATNKIPQVDHLIDQAADKNTHYRIWAASKKIKQAQEIMAQATKDAENTKEVFTQLLEANRKNQAEFEALIKSYRQTRKEVLSKSFNYGAALDQIENQLTAMENSFDEAKNLSAQGDHVEAKRVLSQIRTKLAGLNENLPKLEAGRKQLAETFQDQLSELSSSYKQMRKDKYAIAEVDVLKQIKSIHDEIDQAQDLLSKLKTTELAASTSKIAKEIDQLYDLLEREYKARPFVEKNRDKMLKLIVHQESTSKQLVQKLEHIDESYELTHGELAKSKKLLAEVQTMDDKYAEQVQAMADGKGVYSEIKESWLEALERLHAIDQEQAQMSQDVDGLYDSENVANDSVNRFKQEVGLVYRRIQRRNLPGTPDSFVQMYTLVINEIAHVSDELNQVRINMEKISDELIQISDDVERLKREADDILNSANLFELSMQYANKYSKNEQVKAAMSKGLTLYQDSYQYKEALDTIATSLEKAEPGSYERLEKTYYQDQSNK
jgi:septation ring formation regulator